MTAVVTVNLPVHEDDDAAFVELVRLIVRGAVVTHQPAAVCVFKIDHWFDHKWLAFSGKTLGALGVWTKNVTVPPFVANRIVNQWHYERDEICGVYQLNGPGANIHHSGWSAENLKRHLNRVTPNSALFWYSGNTLATGRGSLMGYIPVEGEIWPWFLAFIREYAWRINRRKSIHEYELRKFQSAGDQLSAASIASHQSNNR